MAEPAIAGAAVAAAGFAAGRLLLCTPDRALLERFADHADRESWPIRNPRTQVALRILAGPFDIDAVRAEWNRLFDEGPAAIELCESAWTRPADPDLITRLVGRYATFGIVREHDLGRPADHLGVELTYLAHLAALVGRGVTEHDHGAVTTHRAELLAFRRDHLDRFCDTVLDQVAAQATTAPLRALPDLVRGFLAATSELAGLPTSLATSG